MSTSEGRPAAVSVPGAWLEPLITDPDLSHAALRYYAWFCVWVCQPGGRPRSIRDACDWFPSRDPEQIRDAVAELEARDLVRVDRDGVVRPLAWLRGLRP